MQLNFRHTFEAQIDDVWAMFADPASHVAKFEGMGHHDVVVLEQNQTAESLDIVITREVDIDAIPGFARKFIKPRNTVVSRDHWKRNGDECSGQFTLETKGVPMEIEGWTRASADGDVCQYEVRVELKVKVPLIGGKLEGFGKGIVTQQLAEEFAQGDSWLTHH